MTAAVAGLPRLQPFDLGFSIWDRRPATSTGCADSSSSSLFASQPVSCSTTTSSAASLDSMALVSNQESQPSELAPSFSASLVARPPRLREQYAAGVDVVGFSELHLLAICVPPLVAKALQEQRVNELQGCTPYVIVPNLDDRCWVQLADLPDQLGLAAVYKLLGAVAQEAALGGGESVDVSALFLDIVHQLVAPAAAIGTRLSGGSSPAPPSSPAAASASASPPAASPVPAASYAGAATVRANSPAAAARRTAVPPSGQGVYRPPGRRSASGSRRGRDEWWPEVKAAIQALVASSNGMYQLHDFDDALLSHMRELGEDGAWKKLERINDKLYGLRRESIRNMSAFLMSA